MLVDHANAGRDGVTRAFKGHGLPVDTDLPFIGVVQPVQNVHKSRLARTILSEERMDLSRFNDKVDMVIGDKGSKLLCDPDKLKLHLGCCLSLCSSGRLMITDLLDVAKKGGPRTMWGMILGPPDDRILRCVRGLYNEFTRDDLLAERINFGYELSGNVGLEVVERSDVHAAVLKRANVGFAVELVGCHIGNCVEDRNVDVLEDRGQDDRRELGADSYESESTPMM